MEPSRILSGLNEESDRQKLNYLLFWAIDYLEADGFSKDEAVLCFNVVLSRIKEFSDSEEVWRCLSLCATRNNSTDGFDLKEIKKKI